MIMVKETRVTTAFRLKISKSVTFRNIMPRVFMLEKDIDYKQSKLMVWVALRPKLL